MNITSDNTVSWNYGLDFLKIVATVLVVFHHYQQVIGVRYSSGANYYGGWFPFSLVVELFFIISGYLMYRYIDDIYNGMITLKDWYLKRASRLLPLVAVSVVVYNILVFAHNHICTAMECFVEIKEPQLFDSLITSLGIQFGGMFQSLEVNSPTWYISVLLLMYIMFYVCTALAGRIKVSTYYIYLFMVLLGCGIYTYRTNIPFFNGSTYRGIYCFFIGVLLSQYVNKHGISRSLIWGSIGIVLGLMVLLHFKSSFLEHEPQFIVSFLLYPAMIILTETNVSKKALQCPLLGWLAQISFNVYIWHLPAIYAMCCVAHLLGISPNYAQRKWMYLFCVLCYMIGIVSHYLIEKPLKNILKNIQKM